MYGFNEWDHMSPKMKLIDPLRVRYLCDCEIREQFSYLCVLCEEIEARKWNRIEINYQ